MSATHRTTEAFRRDALRVTASIRAVIERRGDAPPHVHRGYCLDCDAAVELLRDDRCYCGSRSIAPLRPRRVA